MPRPDPARVFAYFNRYISQVKEDDLMTAFRNQTDAMFSFFESIPVNKHDYAYAENKWTLKEVLQHMIDAERVMSYRALTFSRKDKNSLPGFEENDWAAASNASTRSWKDLIEEFKALRKATEYMFASFSNEQLEASGVASNNPIYVLGLGFICVGHCTHHITIIKERYLK